MPYSLPRRLYNQAISSSIAITVRVHLIQYLGIHCYDLHTIRPALFFLSSSLRRSSIFSANFLPANSISSTDTFSFGRGGRSSPQTRSTRLALTPRSSAPPFFFIFSDNLRASAVESKKRPAVGLQLASLRAVMTVGSTPTVLRPSDCSAVLEEFRNVLGSHLALPFLPCRNVLETLLQ